MARRRGNREGSLYRRKDGLWCAQVSLQGQRLTKYGKTQVECRTWIKEMLQKIDGGLTLEGSQVTLDRFVESWLNGKAISRRPNTVEQYRLVVKLHILPVLGQFRLQEIRPAQIKRLYELKRDQGTGPRTIQLIHTTLHNILKQAVKDGILSRNAASAVERPTVEHAEMKTFTEQEARQFLIAASGSKFEAVYYLALSTGMREGELLGLRWSDVDWNKGILSVRRQLQAIKGRGLAFLPPKTKAGLREIKVGPVTLRQLDAHRSRQAAQRTSAGDQWQEHDLIFPTTIGTPLDCRRVTDEFKVLLQRAGLPKIRFHDLRHTSLNTLLDNDIPLNTVQRRGGHAKASTTINIYGHSTVRSQEAAAQKIEELITPIPVELQ